MTAATKQALRVPAPTIADAWATGRNNFNLMRLVAAWLVIYGHASAITGIPFMDAFAWITRFRGAGAVAVDMFFVASGFLIAASLERNTTRGYLVSRGLRILPALVVCVALTTFVLGPVLTSAPGYWTDGTTWKYFAVNASLLLSRFHLPGVFESHPTAVVNGSLWTLPNEARLYLLLLVAWLAGVVTPRRYTPLWMLAAVAGYALAWAFWPLPDHVQKYAECAAFFTTGTLLWVNRHTIRLSGWVVLAFVVALLALRATAWAHLPYFALLTYGTLWLALRVRLPLVRRTDLSYGLYLYGWPAQQLAWMLPVGKTIAGNILVASAIAVPLAVLSWFLVERPALRLKKRWVAKAPSISPVGAEAQ